MLPKSTQDQFVHNNLEVIKDEYGREFTIDVAKRYVKEGRFVKQVHKGFDGSSLWVICQASEHQNPFGLIVTYGDHIDIGRAIDYLKQGKMVTCDDWDCGDKLYYVPANKYPAARNTLDTIKGVFKGDMVPYKPYIARLHDDKSVSAYVPTAQDLLSTRWRVIIE